jgi:hypothetical protein
MKRTSNIIFFITCATIFTNQLYSDPLKISGKDIDDSNISDYPQGSRCVVSLITHKDDLHSAIIFEGKKTNTRPFNKEVEKLKNSCFNRFLSWFSSTQTEESIQDNKVVKESEYWAKGFSLNKEDNKICTWDTQNCVNRLDGTHKNQYRVSKSWVIGLPHLEEIENNLKSWSAAIKFSIFGKFFSSEYDNCVTFSLFLLHKCCILNLKTPIIPIPLSLEDNAKLAYTRFEKERGGVVY